MPIRVICPGCHATFNVSDKFAGKEGPCPKCKKKITIPKTSEAVVIHEEDHGPKDSQGRSVLKPIEREETKYPMPLLIATGVGFLLVPLIAFILGRTFEVDAEGIKQAPRLVLAVGAALLALPITLAGYSILRNDDIEPYRGQPLYMRAGVCALVHVLTWGIAWYVGNMINFGAPTDYFITFPAMVIPGALASLATLDLDGFSASVHYGFYLFVTILLRLIMGIGIL